MSHRAKRTAGLGIALAAGVLAGMGGGLLRLTVANARQQPTGATAITGQSATQLADGRWLVLGGESAAGVARSAAIVDPRTGVATPLPVSMTAPRAQHTATLLTDGTLLIVGGHSALGDIVETAELFDPEVGAFMPIAFEGGTPRAGHSATLLSDGRVLVAGGAAPGGRPASELEIWDVSAQRVVEAGRLGRARSAQTATLLGDGRVAFSDGVDADGRPVPQIEIFDPRSGRVVAAAPPDDDGAPVRVMEATPGDSALDVPVDVRVALRFSRPLRIDTVNASTVTLSGTGGRVDVLVVPAEGGRLLFVTPRAALQNDAKYTLTFTGAVDVLGVPLASPAMTFVTVAESRTTGHAPDEEAWAPGADGNGWTSNRPDSPSRSLPPLQAPPGATALAGQVLRLDGKPLPDVTLAMEGRTARSDRTGRFLLRLEGLVTGEHTLVIDARTANRPGRTYGFYEARIGAHAGRTTVLPFTIWSPLLDTAHAIEIASPTTGETVVTTPTMPGLELHLPPGTVIHDEDGQVVRKVTMTPIPLDRTPFALPEEATFTMFFTIQPGGAYISTPGPIKGAWLVYPARTRHRAGTKVPFYNYDPDDKGWYVYGLGTVTPTQVVPEPTTRLYAFTGASFGSGPTPPPSGWTPGGNHPRAEPIDPSTGTYVMQKTDLYLPDVMPLALTRTYNASDTDPANARAFGIGMTHAYGLFQWSASQFAEGDLILPDGGRIHYTRISNPSLPWNQTVMECQAAPTAFYKAKLFFDGNAWEHQLKDGTVYIMGHSAALQAIRDRYGNTTRLTWSQTNTFGAGVGNLLRVTSPNGRWIAFTYDTHVPVNRVTTATDNLGRTVSYAYDAGGHLSTVTDPEQNVTTYTWDANHRLATIKDGRNIVYLTNQYDASGRVSTQTLADPAATYSLAYTTDQSGNITQTAITDPRNHVERLTFNSSHYVTSDVEAVGTPEERTTTYERQSGSNLVTAMVESLIVGGVSRRTAYTYDSTGHVQTITRLDGTPDAVTTTFTYEPQFFQLATITDPLTHTWTVGYDAQGRIASVTDPLTHQTTYTTNAAGQVTSVTDPLQHTWQFGYTGGDLVSTTDPLNAISRRFVDSAGRVLSTTDPLGRTTRLTVDKLNRVTAAVDPIGAQTQLQYDPNSRVLSLTDALSHATSYTYDTSDRVATRIDPLVKTATYGYDGNNNLTQLTDRKGQVTSYQYDALDRLTQVTYADTTTTTYTYDAGNRLTQITEALAGITREYDGLDRLTSETTPEGSVSYTYDTAGRRVTMTVTGQATVTYAYDNANRLTSITQGASVVSFTYDDADRRSTLTLPNGVVTTYGYDNANQLTSLTYTLGPTTLGTLTYGYDAAGNRTTIGGTWARTGLPPALASATYDAANRITAWAGQPFSYDSNGNLASDGLTSYVWNARNQLTGLSGGVSASFTYDGFGRRRVKTAAGTTSFFYDGPNIVQELVGSTPTANLLTGGVDEVFQRVDATGTRAFLTDAIGSTMALADEGGALRTQYSYEPFGNATNSGSASPNAAQYTGRENDGTGLDFYRARYYSPTLGRFISEDPLGLAGGMNLFAYTDNAPTNANDPSGLFSCKWHRILTQANAVDAGYTLQDAWALAQQVCDVDKGTQSDSPSDTHGHAMGGRKDNDKYENCKQAYDGAKDLLRRLMEQNKLAEALHLIQDQWPTGHRFQPWYGFGQPLGQLLQHAYGDHFPSLDVLRHASADTARFIKDFLNHNVGDPSDYLHNTCK